MLPVEVPDGQASLLTAHDYILSRHTHVSHLFFQKLTTQVLPID